MNTLEFLVNLRSEIICVIGRVENSGHSWAWDNTTPNNITKSVLNKIYEKYILLGADLGFFLVNRHSPCGHPDHDQYGIDSYVMDDINGEKTLYKDSRFVWSYPIEQGKVVCKCPCSETNTSTLHYVVRDAIFAITADKKVCEAVQNILEDLYKAKQKSEDNKPRAAIREYLLRAVLKINDAILPRTMDDYIEHQCRISGMIA